MRLQLFQQGVLGHVQTELHQIRPRCTENGGLLLKTLDVMVLFERILSVHGTEQRKRLVTYGQLHGMQYFNRCLRVGNDLVYARRSCSTPQKLSAVMNTITAMTALKPKRRMRGVMARVSASSGAVG